MNDPSLMPKWRCIIALISGALLPLAFAPTHIFWLCIVCPAALAALWQTTSTVKHAILIGFLFGLGFFGVGASWILNSIYVYGNTNLAIALAITTLFVSILALFFAIHGFLLQTLFARPTLIKILVAFPSLWVLLEWLRSWILSGFPWLLLGHSAVPSPISSMAPITGVYGLSFILSFLAALLAIACLPQLIVNNPPKVIRWQRSNIAGLSLLLIIGACNLSHLLHWTKIDQPTFNVSLVQGNIPQQLRWDPDHTQTIVNRYQALTQPLWTSKLIVWPEAAIPLTFQQAHGLYQQLAKQAREAHSTLLTGLPAQQGSNYYNAAMTLGNNQNVYNKRHLVPFGEYVPFANQLRGLIGFFDLPMSNFLAGNDDQALLTVDQLPIAVFICYEIAYPPLLRHDLPAAQVLVTISDDDWFGRSFAPWQHLQIAQFQAAASSRPLIFASNSGSSAFIDSKGNIEASLPPFIAGTLTHSVQPETGATPWVWLGDTPFILACALLLLAGYISGKRTKSV